ncbi:6 [Commensalibacter communis]|uniref:6,7-dimethyl-8-ribityllumazine synthase n=1 Tax=Commensalibacter communis TaxID=2972786 RepID=A0A9W4TSG8_9PROT|nr:6,7-dimethyl-8-ribityllumazine synthase [Commensalibacter communis]CAI3948366.1 6 [Commensalibacter communis] [Commensalibacter communis]CAI3951444.1 6 [Commensalibacter communis] [Commensalibacter communis]CAI3951558.1 6 [Commensalibacter communis] [Commensalibacter communis]CAI3952690.1 6 [Commensalibacter communis] [Commensalibacter communis]CAI3953046.1 6 [Commensalibacter communis] [Commensalibacter communis]
MIKQAPQSLTEFQFKKMPRIAIVVSRFNEKVTGGLAKGAQEWLAEHHIPFNAEEDLMYAPGAFELPLIAQSLAKSGKYDGVVCLGCVIKGDTAHFEFISLGATIGIMQASLTTETPISFGILTTYTGEQAEIRSEENKENKGREAVAACIESLALIQNI